MSVMCPAFRCRIGALLCGAALVVSIAVFVAAPVSHDHASALGICMLDAILLIAGMLLYRRSRRLTPANPLTRHYQVERTGAR